MCSFHSSFLDALCLGVFLLDFTVSLAAVSITSTLASVPEILSSLSFTLLFSVCLPKVLIFSFISVGLL